MRRGALALLALAAACSAKPPEAPPPRAVIREGLSAAAPGVVTFVLEWTDVAEATGYAAHVRKPPATWPSTPQPTPLASTLLGNGHRSATLDVAAVPSEQVGVAVSAYNATNSSERSNEIVVVVPTYTVTPSGPTATVTMTPTPPSTATRTATASATVPPTATPTGALDCGAPLAITGTNTGTGDYCMAPEVGCTSGANALGYDVTALHVQLTSGGSLTCAVATRSGTTMTTLPGCTVSATGLGSGWVTLTLPAGCRVPANTALYPQCITDPAAEVVYGTGTGQTYYNDTTCPYTAPPAAWASTTYAPSSVAMYLTYVPVGAPTATTTRTATITPSATPPSTATWTRTPSRTPTASAFPTPSATRTASATPSGTASRTVSATPTASLTRTASATATQTPLDTPQLLRCDVDHDGDVGVMDAVKILRSDLRSCPECDLDGNRRLQSADALLVLDYLVGTTATCP